MIAVISISAYCGSYQVKIGIHLLENKVRSAKSSLNGLHTVNRTFPFLETQNFRGPGKKKAKSNNDSWQVTGGGSVWVSTLKNCLTFRRIDATPVSFGTVSWTIPKTKRKHHNIKAKGLRYESTIEQTWFWVRHACHSKLSNWNSQSNAFNRIQWIQRIQGIRRKPIRIDQASLGTFFCVELVGSSLKVLIDALRWNCSMFSGSSAKIRFARASGACQCAFKLQIELQIEPLNRISKFYVQTGDLKT